MVCSLIERRTRRKTEYSNTSSTRWLTSRQQDRPGGRDQKKYVETDRLRAVSELSKLSEGHNRALCGPTETGGRGPRSARYCRGCPGQEETREVPPACLHLGDDTDIHHSFSLNFRAQCDPTVDVSEYLTYLSQVERIPFM